MKVLCFTSFTYSYLNRARVLFASLRRFHPDWELVALITDELPPGVTVDVRSEPFDRVVHASELGIPDYLSWLFKHDVVEVCTAVKGPFLRQACEAGAVDAVVYLDPDTCLFASLAPVTELLETHDILLTPHLIEPNDVPLAIEDNDVATLRTGIYNLGFLAVRTSGEGARFARWWSERLLTHCYDDIPHGLFVDQRWCDHVPALFDRVKVLRDPGYNVASWNLSRRTVTVEKDGRILVNGAPLRFWHFTKLGEVGDAMTRRYAGDNFPVYELWAWYKRKVIDATEAAIPKGWWAYGCFADGKSIERAHRLTYRREPRLQAAYPNPYAAGPGAFRSWLAEHRT
jgi:hypothetical protein